jgi:hypothetical protein
VAAALRLEVEVHEVVAVVEEQLLKTSRSCCVN